MLAPAYFSPNCKYFDQLLQTVKNKTTVLILVFKGFLQINSTTDFCTLGKRVSRFSVENLLSHSTEKLRRGTLFCFTKFLVSKKFMDKRGGGVSRFSIKTFLSHSAEKFRRGTLLCFTKFLVSKNFMDKRGEGGSITIFYRKYFVSRCRKIS